MDSIVSSALEEICSQGNTGLSLSSLWFRLSPLAPSVKASVWRNLLSVPSLQFKARNTVYGPEDPSIQCLEAAEKLDLKIFAGEKLRDNFVGLYDALSNNTSISAVQRRVLERLAVARMNGVTQNQLAKEFGIEGKNLFYILRNLESRGLIVKQPAIVRTKEPYSDGQPKNNSCITTNMVYLSRYARPLGALQRFEISKEDCSVESLAKEGDGSVVGDGLVSESFRGDMLIKDFLPAMQAVCDKLEEANGKVLVVSDIKYDLGYTGSHSGHRAWRSVCRRLKDANVVEEFDAVVKDKVERCLRLLRKFSPKNFEARSIGFGSSSDKKQFLKFGRVIQRTDQLLELSIDQQIYDMVDAEGSKGLPVMEVCERLGIDKKRNYSRLCSMFSRFGMHLQAENHKRTTAFRVWTSHNAVPEPSNNHFQGKPENLESKNNTTSLDPSTPLLESGRSTSECDFATPGKSTDAETTSGISPGSPLDGKANNMITCHVDLQEPLNGASGKASDTEISTPTLVPSDKTSLALLKSPNSRAHQAHPLTADGARREQRIIERLQEEKFILRAELHKWLLSFEKDKSSKMDRKTIDRILNKLQKQGQCKCMAINVPNVTNCGRNRSSLVVLHPSIHTLTPALISEIHDRIRSFEMGLRGQGSSKGKNDSESVPILNDVQRSQNRVDLDTRSSRSEAMRANGFVLAKMVRAKLLHNFLWDHFSSLPGWEDVLLSIDHRFRNLFSLEDALKAMPLELFLQVVGSTQKFDDMIKKCKNCLRLSDLLTEEYKLLMDTLATGRLSMLIDILRRLKLIRLVSSEHTGNAIMAKQASLTHSMELKPYIEEPVFVVATYDVASQDLRPRIRHDFILSSREAVDDYWLTLEYCYAAAEPRAAVQAFPGSVVHEVYLFRSWASIRVMTAEQRAELLKRIVKDNPNQKLAFKECERIAKDLNLTLEQVLRVYHDKHQRRLNRFQGTENSKKGNESVDKPSSSSRKRRRSLKARSMNSSGDGIDSEQTGERKVVTSDAADQSMRDQHLLLDSSRENNSLFSMHEEDDSQETSKDKRPTEDEEQCYSIINQYANSKMKPPRQQRFTWTDEADRQLLIQYVRQRAILGARFHGVDWASIPALPATPAVCKRKIASLKRNKTFRKALMRVCTMLSERYAKHLERQQRQLPNNNDHHVLIRCSCGEIAGGNQSTCVVHGEDTGFDEERWDSFNEKSIRKAFDDLLQLKQMAKLAASKGTGSGSQEWSNRNIRAEEHEDEMVIPAIHTKEIPNASVGQGKDSAQRSERHRLHQKFKILNEKVRTCKQVQESLAVSNSVELLKLTFLSSRTMPNMQNLLAETLRRYSERDLFAAYSYLRDKKFLIGGSGGQPFVLSQHFLHSLSKSPFPINTGKGAAKFSNWLLENESDLMAGGVNLTTDLQCADVFYFFSLVSSGELSISPSLPEESVGEAEDQRSLKRKAEDTEECEAEKAKKLKFLAEGEVNFRREKGFPGIAVFVRRATLTTTDAIELFKHDDSRNGELHLGGETNWKSTVKSDNMEEFFNSCNTTSISGHSGDSPWEAMAHFADCMISVYSEAQVNSLNPEVFKTVCNALQKAGDQGLNMEEVYCLVDIPGEKMCKCLIDVLQTFGRAVKVNGYDSVRVVDSLYRSKYCLTAKDNSFQEHLPGTLPVKSQADSYAGLYVNGSSSSAKDETVNADGVHKVTILNLPEEAQTCFSDEPSVQNQVSSAGGNNEAADVLEPSSGETRMPILPWINADGTINKNVFHGFVRRILGTVMQNPGILEDEIIRRMDVLNPQSCRKLLELMTLEGHIKAREMHQTKFNGTPTLLGTLLGSRFGKSEPICRKHFFSNPKSLSLL